MAELFHTTLSLAKEHCWLMSNGESLLFEYMKSRNLNPKDVVDPVDWEAFISKKYQELLKEQP